MMKPSLAILMLTLPLLAQTPRRPAMSFHDLSARRLDGQAQPLSAYKGKVVLVVNVASECGYTPQYAGLEKLYQARKAQGFEVLGFPCNQFGGQEPGSASDIQGFCQKNFGVTFPLFEKVEVKGAGQSPVYAFLTAQHGAPKWNFHKFLVGKEGQVLAAFPSSVEPEGPELKAALEAALK
jgi:glutathione peroxidase